MLGLNRLSIQSKMILLLLIVSLLSIGVVAWIGYVSARRALRQQIENQLTGIRVSKTATLNTMLAALRDEVIAMSDSIAAIEGAKSFTAAYRELQAARLDEAEASALNQFYANDFLPSL
jgi:sensor domain CHASE-containing protein